jgi:hypothetical protein
MAKHTKDDKDEIMKEQSNLCIFRMPHFRKIADIPALLMALFGASVVDAPSARDAETRFLSKE